MTFSQRRVMVLCVIAVVAACRAPAMPTVHVDLLEVRGEVVPGVLSSAISEEGLAHAVIVNPTTMFLRFERLCPGVAHELRRDGVREVRVGCALLNPGMVEFAPGDSVMLQIPISTVGYRNGGYAALPPGTYELRLLWEGPDSTIPFGDPISFEIRE